MNTVKNIHYLEDVLSGDKAEQLEQGATQYRRHANITFKVLKEDKEKIIVEVRQGKNSLDRYLSLKELNKRGKDLFGRFFPDHNIHTRPKHYKRPPADQVTPKWISDQMTKKEIRIKDLESFTGIDRTNLSAWVNGSRPMSQPVKAMFFSLFTENLEKKLAEIN